MSRRRMAPKPLGKHTHANLDNTQKACMQFRPDKLLCSFVQGCLPRSYDLDVVQRYITYDLNCEQVTPTCQKCTAGSMAFWVQPGAAHHVAQTPASMFVTDGFAHLCCVSIIRTVPHTRTHTVWHTRPHHPARPPCSASWNRSRTVAAQTGASLLPLCRHEVDSSLWQAPLCRGWGARQARRRRADREGLERTGA